MEITMKKNLRFILSLLFCSMLQISAFAYINPNFTPTDLVKQSDTVLFIEFTGVDGKGVASAKVQEVLKGKFASKALQIELLAGVFKAQGEAAKKQIQGGQKNAMLFIGSFKAEGVGDIDIEDGAIGFLHIANKWLVLYKVKDSLWELDKEEARLLGTWAGGTKMLLSASKYVLKNPDADFPIHADRTWGKKFNLGKLEGKINKGKAVDINGDGKAELFIASDKGDRIFSRDKDSMKDITGKLKLSSASLAFAWGDFNKDGLRDLASWDGKALSVYSQNKEGSFKKLCSYNKGLLQDKGCLELVTIDSGKSGRPALIAGTKTAPMLLTLKANNTFEEKVLAEGQLPIIKGDKPQRLFCADFDGDALVDLIQLFPGYSLFYKGKGSATFSVPVKINPGVGKGVNGSCLGDYDADGLLDISTVAGDKNRIWQNNGNGKFIDSIDRAGEIFYISKPGGICTATGDLNNDGRQDILIAYEKLRFPQIFFNRGFRSFGYAKMLDLLTLKNLPEAAKGQQAGIIGDFNHDGALDMCLILPDGNIWLLTRKMEEDADLAVLVGLSTASSTAGPVNVTASRFGRPFGAQVIDSGGKCAFFGMREPGPITISWQFPGQKKQSKEIIVEDKPVYLLLGDK